MAVQNFPDNVLYELDNLDVLRGMNSETVDLIATDPPFNTKRNRSGTAGFYVDNWKWGDTNTLPDQWKWNEVHPQWLDDIKDDNPELYQVIEATRVCHGNDTAAFLCFLSVRLLEMHRVLKPTGSMYLHCDHTANGYIRMCMDAIFGKNNLINEIAWLRKDGEKHNLAKRRFPQAHDTLLYFAKSSHYAHNPIMEPYDDKYVKKHYKFMDSRGQYATFPCTNEKGGNKIYEFKGIKRAWRFCRQTMQEMYENDLLTQATPTSPFRYKKYLSQAEGVKVPDIWTTDVTKFAKNERTGSPDQKPLKLYERIIEASSNENDLVLDPFCGCATTIIAARNLKRRWVGVDRRPDARYHIITRMAGMTQKKRKELEKYATDSQWLNGQMAKFESYYSPNPPHRTDVGDTAAPGLEHVYPEPKSILTHKQMKVILVARFGLHCWGCDFEAPDQRYLELDHIDPRSGGGSNELDNRALLCTPCNLAKSNKLTLTGLWKQNRKKGYLKTRYPIDLPAARAWSRNELERIRKKTPQQLYF